MEQNGIGNMCLTVITNADTNISPMLTKKTSRVLQKSHSQVDHMIASG